MYYVNETDLRETVLVCCILHNFCESRKDGVLERWIVAQDRINQQLGNINPIFKARNIQDLIREQRQLLQSIQQRQMTQSLYNQIQLPQPIRNRLTSYYNNASSISQSATHVAATIQRDQIMRYMY